jgi:hypothetical protein
MSPIIIITECSGDQVYIKVGIEIMEQIVEVYADISN